MLALAVVAFVACDDDDEGLNGWTDTAYVYVQGETLGNDMLKQAVVIETEGLEDATPCVYTFRACINKPAKADATVSLTAAASGGIADMLENTMTLSAESLTIPAGQLASDKVTVTYKKTVKPYLNLASGTPSNAEYMDRTNWSGTLGEGVENVIGNIFDGNTGSDIAANSAPWEFTLDLGAETTMLGANTRHWGSGYAPR